MTGRTTTPKRRKASEAEPDFTFTVAGQLYPVRLDDMTGAIVSRLRRESGMSWRDVMRHMAADSTDLDVIAAVMCVSLWQRGQDDSYEDVSAGLGYQTTVDVSKDDDEPADVDEDADPNG